MALDIPLTESALGRCEQLFDLGSLLGAGGLLRSLTLPFAPFFLLNNQQAAGRCPETGDVLSVDPIPLPGLRQFTNSLVLAVGFSQFGVDYMFAGRAHENTITDFCIWNTRPNNAVPDC